MAAFLLFFGMQNAFALIDSTVIFDIAWNGQTPVDTTYWGTPYQTNVGDSTSYNGMFEYQVSNWSTSTAAIRRFELMFPTSVFTSQVAILGTPAGWDLGVDTGASGSLLIWGRTNTNAILPGQSLDGFLVDFTTNQSTPAGLNNFIQAYDVYQLTVPFTNPDTGLVMENGAGDHGKGMTAPVPEPATMAMLGMGILGLFGLKRKA